MRQEWLKYAFLLLVLFYIQDTHGQAPDDLKKRMWQKANTCYAALEDLDGDGATDYDFFTEDISNGYLTISGWWPTCGCGCFTTVGAYKNRNGEYTLLEQEYWKCSWIRRLSSDRDLLDVLPEGFGIDAFIPDLKTDDNIRYARFYIEAQIPQVGTDTELILKTIPFGIYIENKDLLVYSISELHSENDTTNKSGVNYLNEILNLDIDYNLIPDGKLSDIDEIIANNISKVSGKSEDELRIHLTALKQVYNIYSQIEHKTIILGWDKKKGRFYIKEKGKRPQKISFPEFLRNSEFWSGIC